MSDGYLEITGASDSVDLKVGIGDWEFVPQNEYDKTTLPMRNWFAIDIGERNLRLTVKNAHATSYDDYVTGAQIMDETNDLTIKVRRNNSEYVKLYNGQTALTVKTKTYPSVQEDYAGERFKFKRINFDVVG